MNLDVKKNRFYYNEDFVKSPDGRSIRILSEYYGPLQRLRRNHIQDTIVFFGSARIQSREMSIKDLNIAKKITYNAKLRNTAICGATETIILHEKIIKKIGNQILINLEKNGCKIIGDKKIIQNYVNELKNFTIDCSYDLNNSSGYDYQILVKKRYRLKNYLNNKKIETKVKHPILMADQSTFKKNKKFNLKNARWICKHSLSLPLHRNLSQKDQNYIIDSIKYFYKNN